MIVCRYKIQQDRGDFCLKGCPDGDLTDYANFDAALKVLKNIAVPSMEVKAFLRNLAYMGKTPQNGLAPDHFYEPIDQAAQDKTLKVIVNMVPQDDA